MAIRILSTVLFCVLTHLVVKDYCFAKSVSLQPSYVFMRYAPSERRGEVVKLLLDNGADATLVDNVINFYHTL